MKHPVVCSMLKQLHDEYVSPVDASVALADFKLLVGKARAARLPGVTAGHPCKPWCQTLGGGDRNDSTSQQTFGNAFALL